MKVNPKTKHSKKFLAEKTALLSALLEEKAELEENLRAVESGAGMEALARERLGLVMPGERVFYFATGIG